jgi:hypothetical protein
MRYTLDSTHCPSEVACNRSTPPSSGRWIAQSILGGTLVISNFLPPEEMSLAMLFVVTMAPIVFGLKVPRGVWLAIWPLVGMMFLGLVGSFDREVYDVVKDAWYFGKAILTVIFGYLLMWRLKKIESVLSLFVLSAGVISGMHIFRASMDPSILQEPVGVIHATIGSGYFISVLGVLIILAARKYSVPLFPRRLNLAPYVCAMVCLFSVVISFSRTLWISLAISVVLLLHKSGSKNVRRLATASLLMFVILFTASGLASTLQKREYALGDMVRKITRSFDEVIISDYSDMSDINLHWRGFESFRALRTYESGNALQFLIGQGFGTFVDLGFYMPVEAIDMRFIPVLHNGYLYILMKAGMIGLSLYFYYLIAIFRMGDLHSKSDEPEVKLVGVLMEALVLVFFVTTYVITGMFNKNALFPVTLLLGCLMGFIINIKGKGLKKAHLNLF